MSGRLRKRSAACTLAGAVAFLVLALAVEASAYYLAGGSVRASVRVGMLGSPSIT